MTAIGAVVLLHIGMIWGLKEGLTRQAMELISGPLDVKMIEEILPDEKEPPPPPPKIETPPPFVPPPEIAIDIPIDVAPATAITATNVKPPPAPPPMGPPVVRTPPRSDPRRPFTEPEYPPTSRRLGQEGTVVLLIYVLADGKVGDVKVHKSSGFPKLDEAAVKEARRSWRFIPAKDGNTAVPDWGQFAVTFRLTDD